MLAVLGIEADAWGQRHGIEAFTAPCDECGRPLTTSVPFAWGERRGLVAPACECGNTHTPYCIAWSNLPSGPDRAENATRRGPKRTSDRVLRLRQP